MRFTLFTSLTFTLVAAVNAIPTTGTSSFPELAARDVSLGGSTGQDQVYYTRDESNTSLEARAKFKANKITLSIPKKLKQGSIPQNKLEATTELAKCAMFEASVTEGTVLYGWHGAETSSKDSVSHITVQPTSGTGASNGNIHVHIDGSWSQGPNGKITGTGHSC